MRSYTHFGIHWSNSGNDCPPQDSDLENWENYFIVSSFGDSLAVSSSTETAGPCDLFMTKVEIFDNTPAKWKGIGFNTTTVENNSEQTTSVYVKNGDQRYVGLFHYRFTDRWSHCVFDLQTGTITQESKGISTTVDPVASIVDQGDGTYLISMTSSEPNTNFSSRLTFVSSGTPTFSTQGTEIYTGTLGLFIYASQLTCTAYP